MVTSLATDLWLTGKDYLQLKTIYCRTGGFTDRATSSHPVLVPPAVRGPAKSVHLCGQWKNGKKSTAAREDKKAEGS